MFLAEGRFSPTFDPPQTHLKRSRRHLARKYRKSLRRKGNRLGLQGMPTSAIMGTDPFRTRPARRMGPKVGLPGAKWPHLARGAHRSCATIPGRRRAGVVNFCPLVSTGDQIALVNKPPVPPAVTALRRQLGAPLYLDRESARHVLRGGESFRHLENVSPRLFRIPRPGIAAQVRPGDADHPAPARGFVHDRRFYPLRMPLGVGVV